MDQVHLIVHKFARDNRTVRLLSLGVLPIKFHVLALDETFLLQGHLEPLRIVIQRRVGDNLMLSDSDHLGRQTGSENKTHGQENC